MIRDGGATVIFQWTYSQAKPHDVIWNQNFGHLGTGLPYAVGAMVAEGGKRPGMLLTSDSSFLFHISELEDRRTTEAAARVRGRRRQPVGSRGGRLQAHLRQRLEGDRACTGARTCASTRSPKASAATANTSSRREDIGPAIKRAYASGKTAVIHVPIDPMANSEEMPNYGEFRTWYAEGQQ